VFFSLWGKYDLKLFLQREFALLLLPIISRKLNRTIPSLLTRPSLLAHTIYQALAFDAALLEGGFDLSGTSASRTQAGDGAKDGKDKWDGISEVILGKKEWFDAWMEGEKKCELGQDSFIVLCSHLIPASSC
jgi:hypothetical protein